MQTQTFLKPTVRSRRYSFYQKLFFLYILNLCDWACTEALLASGRFTEANPIMRPVLGDFLPTLLIKCVLPLMITLLCALFYKLAKAEESRAVNIMINAGIVAYTLVNLWHVVNFLLLFYAK